MKNSLDDLGFIAFVEAKVTGLLQPGTEIVILAQSGYPTVLTDTVDIIHDLPHLPDLSALTAGGKVLAACQNDLIKVTGRVFAEGEYTVSQAALDVLERSKQRNAHLN